MVTKLDQLPDEILIKIFGFFTKKELAQVACVSKKYQSLAKDPALKHLPGPLRHYSLEPIANKSKIFGTGFKQTVNQLVSLSNGHFISLTNQGILHEWDGRQDEPLLTLDVKDSHQGYDMTHLIAYSNHKVIICLKNKIYLWDIQQGKPTQIFEAHHGDIQTAELLSNNLFVTGSNDKTLRIWDLNQKTCLYVLEGHQSAIQFTIPFPDLNILVSATKEDIRLGEKDTTIRVWDYREGKCLSKLKGRDAEITAMAALNGHHIVIGYVDRRLEIWDVKTATLNTTFSLPEGIPHLMCVLPDNRFACGTTKYKNGYQDKSPSFDSFVYIYDLNSNDIVKTLAVREESIKILAHLPNDYLICDAGRTVKNYQTLDIWDIRSWKRIQTLSIAKLEQNAGRFTCVHEYEHIEKLLLLLNNNFVVGTGYSGLIKLWSFPEVKLIHDKEMEEQELARQSAMRRFQGRRF